MAIIRPETCRTCKFRSDDLDDGGQHVCRWGPPSLSIYVAPTPTGPQLMKTSGFPPVPDDWFCHRYRVRILTGDIPDRDPDRLIV